MTLDERTILAIKERLDEHLSSSTPDWFPDTCAWAERIAAVLPQTAVLHGYCLHPDYEYATTKCGRKAGPAPEPEGEGWESNVDRADGGWERFDFHEEQYWRRPIET